ncbi:MAG: response regulator [Desulfobacteraceae bacterium]|nr:response regulator [Desulfobacteraceae bacterium]MBC2756094.1 response regulator [Desulfobacteraceae bacterium]MBC2763749.1 response regulator [ANME-2 cluster archaeon]
MDNIRLLLVDDETDFRAPLKKRLQKRGFAILEAGNGDECQAVMEDTPVDVVVLDVKMPGMSGIEVLEWIKDNHQKTEVILLTGHSSASDGVEGIKQGAFDYLTKPVEFDHLVQKIGQAVEKSRRDAEKQQEAAFKAKMEQQMISTERLASLGTLSTGIAHEIDNPLAIIKESAEYMRLLLGKAEHADMPRKSDFENAVGKIETAIERAKRITHQLLGFVRKPETFFAETDLKVLVAETVEFAVKEAENKGIQIVQDMAGVNGIIWSDPYEIRQVLFNLLTNAIAAIGSDGTITVSLKDTDSRTMLIVEDTGEGIPKENLEKIFEPFFTTKPPGMGTGLGLYVICGIIERLGGKIDIASRVGKGTRFQVTLPRSRETCGDMGDNKDICVDILNKIKGDPAK